MALDPRVVEVLNEKWPLYRDDPVGWIEFSLDAEPLEPHQIKIAEGLAEHRFVTVATGGGVGKTSLFAMLALWFLTTRVRSNILVTAPTLDAVETRFWKELVRWIKSSKGGLIEKLVEWNQSRAYIHGFKEEWFIVPRTDRKDAQGEVSEALSGFHSESGMMAIIDEASGLEERVYAAIEGAMTGEESYVLMGCFSRSVEILTNKGWKLVSALQNSDKVLSQDKDGTSKFFPLNKIYKYDFDEELISFKHGSGELTVTPEHRVIHKWGTSKNFKYKMSLATADNVYQSLQKKSSHVQVGIPCTIKWTGKESSEYRLSNEVVFGMDDWLEFLGWFISEGSLDKGSKRKNWSRIQISQAKKNFRNEIISCIERLGFTPQFNQNDIRISNTVLAMHLNKIVGRGCDKKRIPNFIQFLSPRQIRIFLEAYQKGDEALQKSTNAAMYWTTSEDIANMLQILTLKIGQYCSIKDDSHNGREATGKIGGRVIGSTKKSYTVFERRSQNLTFKKAQVKKIPYKGTVYCVDVKSPSHLVMTRDLVHKYPAWSHNSNPTRSKGSFARSWNEKTEKDLWFHVQCSSAESQRVAPTYVERMKRRFGEHSDIYRSKVLGLFPRETEGADTIFENVIEVMRAATPSEEIEPKVIVIGIDVARYGTDSTVLIGRRGFEIFHMSENTYADIPETADWIWLQVVKIHTENKDYPIEINIDATGYGAGVADLLKRKIWDLKKKDENVDIRLNYIESTKKASDPMYFNVRAESFFEARELMEKCYFNHNRVDADIPLAQLENIAYFFKNDRIIVEDKPTIRKRRGNMSPDHADALILTLNIYSNKNYESVRKTHREEAAFGTWKRLRKRPVFASKKFGSIDWSGGH